MPGVHAGAHHAGSGDVSTTDVFEDRERASCSMAAATSGVNADRPSATAVMAVVKAVLRATPVVSFVSAGEPVSSVASRSKERAPSRLVTSFFRAPRPETSGRKCGSCGRP